MTHIPHWCRKGQKVVCLNSVWARGHSLPLATWWRAKLFGLPFKGGVYEITDVGFYEHGCGLRLKYFGTLIFHPGHFRPLVSISGTLESDIALFKRIAAEAPAQEDA